MTKFITICIPTFNSEKFLPQSLNSVSIATKNYQFIDKIFFCDNNSTDKTLEIIDNFIENNYKASLISSSDKGQSDAINKAISMTTSSYFMWLNSDDILHDDFFSEVHKFLSLNFFKRKYFTISADVVHIDSDSIVLYRGPCIRDKEWVVKKGIWFGSFPCRIFLTEIAKELKISVNLKYTMDFDFIYRYAVSKKHSRVEFSYNLNKFLGYFRHHALSKTTSGRFTNLIEEETNLIHVKSIFFSYILRLTNLNYLYRRFFKKIPHIN